MRVDELGEFALIDRLSKVLERPGSSGKERARKLLLSIGDDTAAWKADGTEVFTTDTMVEGVHFRRETTGWRNLGWKSLAVNVSDVAAMGCRPQYAIVTLGLPGDTAVENMEEMYEGMAEGASHYGFEVVGGDVVKSPVLFITVALIGHTMSQKVLTRSAARPGDLIGVTGHLGCSGAGLRALSEKLPLDNDTRRHFIEAHNRPQPSPDDGVRLLEAGVRCAMDVSDGLVNDLGKICEMSDVAAALRLDSLPADEYLKRGFPKDWTGLALGGGEDYVLLFTAAPDVMQKLDGVTVVGEIKTGAPDISVLDAQGKPVELKNRGWDHFGD
ncbi:MAG: thiamine-phosphate kinase [Chloroflexi bacterium]|nr:thiamine-phosphate kinase [Chloroflexota bacterium]